MGEKGLFYYKTTFINDEQNTSEITDGIVYAPSYLEACENIIKFYGENNIVDFYIYGLDPLPVFGFKDIKAIRKEAKK